MVPGPPGDLIAAPMKLAMVQAAEGNGELIAHAATECGGLRESHVVGIRWSSATHEARLQRHELKVIPVAVPARFGQRQVGFVDTRHT